MIFRRLRSDDRGSLTMALLVITVGMTLSAFLAPVVVRQIQNTRGLADRNTALNAAQAGMDMMMARVRAASDEKGLSGLLERLPPCAMDGDAGVPGTNERLRYEVAIEYRDQDDVKLNCRTDGGPNNVPATASLTVVGYAPRNVARTLTATYVFNTSNTNIPGGSIRIDSSTLGQQCIDSGGAKSPANGTRVTMQTCNGSSRQRFGYTPDLYLKLIYSETTTVKYGMCLDVGATHTSGNFAAFQPCPPPDLPRTPRFQWSLDNNSQYHSTGPTSNIENLCLSVNSPGSANSLVALGSCSGAGNRTVWRSEPGVGAGMASDETAQLVNYDQFSRCLDVTNNSTGSNYMIAWFCKQSPNGVVNWNQQWVHPTPKAPAVSVEGNIIVTTNGTQFCLKSPLSPASNAYTTVTNCNSAAAKNANDVRWTVYHDTGDYGTSYRIMDRSKYCLVPTDLNATPKDTHSDGTSKVKVAVCNSSEAQKWNAPPNINKPTPLTDLAEK